jgi:hypothetical protein
LLHLLKVHDRQAELFEVVGTLTPPGRLTTLLHGGQQHGDQDRDDRDHHQQLDQGESGSVLPHRRSLLNKIEHVDLWINLRTRRIMGSFDT